MSQRQNIEISMEEARQILGSAFKYAMSGALQYGGCDMCGQQDVETVIRDLQLTSSGRILVNGWCINCKNKRQRSIDTREFPEVYEAAMGFKNRKK